MSRYVGITLGPIGDTMSLTSTPAGLWAASYLFSHLAHSIRENIDKEGLIQDDLEYASGKTVSSLLKRGIGLYHDRIIYEADENHTLEQANEAVRRSVNSVVDGFAESTIFKGKREELKNFFYSYFNIHMISIEVGTEENFLFAINDALDAAELEKNFSPKIKSNPILEIFEGNDKGKNEEIKNSFLVSGAIEGINSWVLFDQTDKSIKDLPSIAAEAKATQESEKNSFKASVYYAVIRADGDNMGSTIKNTISDENKYIEFSNNCLKYGCNTAEIVLKYGGIPIYVGGDDLLCIVPLMSRFNDENHTFMEMIQEIRDEFKKIFDGEPDLSFGVQIQYVKAPLYEALNESGRLLFGTAKSNKPGALAINLKKHSGQSAEILIKNIGNQGKEVLDTVNSLIRQHATEDMLKSVGKHISDYSVLLNQAARSTDDLFVDHFFTNIFDNGMSKADLVYLDDIKKLTKLCKSTGDYCNIAETVGSFIRFIKFFSEKVEREEAKP